MLQGDALQQEWREYTAKEITLIGKIYRTTLLQELAAIKWLPNAELSRPLNRPVRGVRQWQNVPLFTISPTLTIFHLFYGIDFCGAMQSVLIVDTPLPI